MKPPLPLFLLYQKNLQKWEIYSRNMCVLTNFEPPSSCMHLYAFPMTRFLLLPAYVLYDGPYHQNSHLSLAGKPHYK